MSIYPADCPRLARYAALALLLLAAPAAAAPQSTAAPAASVTSTAIPTTAAEREALRRSIDRLYEVLPTHDGVLLRPRSQRVGVRTIELVGDDISVNGSTIPAGAFREWVGASQADPVIRLGQLDPAARRALFDIKPEPGSGSGSAVAAAPSAVPPVPAAPAAPLPPAAAPAVSPAPAGAEGTDVDEAQGSEEGDEEPAKPSGHAHRAGSGSIVRFAGSVFVAPGENPEQVTALAGSVTVDGDVGGDVTAVGGSCTINGRVEGSVTSVGGSVHLGPHSYVAGDVTSVGGAIDKSPGAQVHGSTSEVSAMGHDRERGLPWMFSPLAGVGRLIETLTKILLLALFVCLVLLVARPTVERIAMRVGAEPGPSGLTGFLAQLAFLPLLVVVTVVLAITVIGCALFLLYPFVFLALMLAGLVGYAAVALRLGGWAEERFGWRYASPYMMAIGGVALLEFLPFVGRLLGLVSLLHPLALAARLAGFLIEYLAWTVGFGAVILDFLAAGGFRQWRRGGVPPIPPSPAPAYAAPASVPAPMAPPAPAAPAPEPPPAPPADPWESR